MLGAGEFLKFFKIFKGRNAEKIKDVTVDDTAKADGYALKYVASKKY